MLCLTLIPGTACYEIRCDWTCSCIHMLNSNLRERLSSVFVVSTNKRKSFRCPSSVHLARCFIHTCAQRQIRFFWWPCTNLKLLISRIHDLYRGCPWRARGTCRQGLCNFVWVNLRETRLQERQLILRHPEGHGSQPSPGQLVSRRVLACQNNTQLHVQKMLFVIPVTHLVDAANRTGDACL